MPVLHHSSQLISAARLTRLLMLCPFSQDLRESLAQQRQAFTLLHQATATCYLEPGIPYGLLPRPWMQAWRRHLSAGHRKDGAAPPPGDLDDALDGLVCDCHRASDPRLAYPPPTVSKR